MVTTALSLFIDIRFPEKQQKYLPGNILEVSIYFCLPLLKKNNKKFLIEKKTDMEKRS